MSDQDADRVVERFRATNGRISGYLGLGCAAVILALAIAAWDAGQPLGWAIIALLGGLLAWVAMLRPAMWVTDRDLVLRSMYHTDAVPLAAIDKVAVGQVTAVTVDEKRYVSPVVGYSARQTIMQRAGARKPSAKTASAADTYQVFVEERIAHLAKEARERYGDPAGAGVRRTYAWPEIVGTGLLVVAFLVWLVIF